MFTTILRIIKYGCHGFVRNGTLAFATIIILILALGTFLGLWMFNVITKQAVITLEEKIDISVYFQKNAPEV